MTYTAQRLRGCKRFERLSPLNLKSNLQSFFSVPSDQSFASGPRFPWSFVCSFPNQKYSLPLRKVFVRATPTFSHPRLTLIKMRGNQTDLSVCCLYAYCYPPILTARPIGGFAALCRMLAAEAMLSNLHCIGFWFMPVIIQSLLILSPFCTTVMASYRQRIVQ